MDTSSDVASRMEDVVAGDYVFFAIHLLLFLVNASLAAVRMRASPHCRASVHCVEITDPAPFCPTRDATLQGNSCVQIIKKLVRLRTSSSSASGVNALRRSGAWIPATSMALR